jgi:hypothetical protein
MASQLFFGTWESRTKETTQLANRCDRFNYRIILPLNDWGHNGCKAQPSKATD